MRSENRRFLQSFHKNPKKVLADTLEMRGSVYLLTGEYSKARADFVKMRDIADSIAARKKVADAVYHIGNVHFYEGDLNQAAHYFNRSLRDQKKCRNKDGVARCHKQLGLLLQQKEKHQAGLNHRLKALDLYRSLKDQYGYNIVLAGIADNYRAQGKFNKALKVLGRVLKYNKKTRNPQWVGVTLLNLGSIYVDMKDFNRGIQLLRQAYRLHQSIGNKTSITYILCKLGIAYFNCNKYREAKKYFLQSYTLAQAQNALYIQAISLLNLGDACTRLHEVKQAMTYLNNVLSMPVGVQGIHKEAQNILDEIRKKEKRR